MDGNWKFFSDEFLKRISLNVFSDFPCKSPRRSGFSSVELLPSATSFGKTKFTWNFGFNLCLLYRAYVPKISSAYTGISFLKQKDTSSSIENNRVEYVFRLSKIRITIFGGLKEYVFRLSKNRITIFGGLKESKSKKIISCNLDLINKQMCFKRDALQYSLTNLGGVPSTCPPKGPDSFVLTYKIFET